MVSTQKEPVSDPRCLVVVEAGSECLMCEDFVSLGDTVPVTDAVPVGIVLALTLVVDERFFGSEVRRAVEQALGRGPGGFFEPGRLRFGEDLHASDLFEALMGVEGVVDITLDKFKRVGAAHPDQSAEGRIALRGLEVAVCDNDPARPERGYFRLNLCGGRRG